MFIEERIYTLHPGRLHDFLKIYQEEGMPIQTRYLPAMVGFYYTEIGTLNLIVHMWAYEDLRQRSALRARMAADPAWQAYLKKVQPFFMHQESRILNPAPFFASKLDAMIKAGGSA